MKFNLISGNGTALFDLFNFSGAETLSPGAGKNGTHFQSLLFNIQQDSKFLNPELISKFAKMADGNSELSEMLSRLMFTSRDAVSIEPAQTATTEQQTLSAQGKTLAWNEIVAGIKDELSSKMVQLGQKLFNRAAGEMEGMPVSGDVNSKSGQEPEVSNILWLGMPLSPELLAQMQALLQTGSADVAGSTDQVSLNSNEQDEGIVSPDPASDGAQNLVEPDSKLRGVAWMPADVLHKYQSESNRMLRVKMEYPTGNIPQNPVQGLPGNEIYLQLFAENEPAATIAMTKEISTASELSKLMNDSEIGTLPQSEKILSSLLPEHNAMQSVNLPLKENSPVSDEKIFTVPGTQIRISSRELPVAENGVVAVPMAQNDSSDASVSVLSSRDANQFAFLVTDAAHHFLRELPETASEPENSNLFYFSRSAKGFVQIVSDPFVNLPTNTVNVAGDSVKSLNLFPANGELNEIDFSSQKNTTDPGEPIVKNLIEQIRRLPVPVEEGVISTFEVRMPNETGSIMVQLKKAKGQILATIQPNNEKTTVLLQTKLSELNEALQATKIHIEEVTTLPQSEGMEMPEIEPGNRNGEIGNMRWPGEQGENTVAKTSSSLNEASGNTVSISRPNIIRMIRISDTVPDDRISQRKFMAGNSARTTGNIFSDGNNSIAELSDGGQFLKTNSELQPSIQEPPAGNGEILRPEVSNSPKFVDNISIKPNDIRQIIREIAGRIVSQYQTEAMKMPDAPVVITPEDSEPIYFSTEKNNGQIVGILQTDDPKVVKQLRETVPVLIKTLQEHHIPVAKMQVQLRETGLSPEGLKQQAGKEAVRQITNQIAGMIQRFHATKERETVKQLQPEDSGRVKTTIVKESGGFVISLQVERPELKKIIEAESGGIKKSLKHKNIPVKNIEVKNTTAQFTADEKIHLSEKEWRQLSSRGEPFPDQNLFRKPVGVKMSELPGQQGHLLPKEIPLKQMMDQIVRSTRMQYLPGKTQIQIHLKPEYLGAVTIVMKDDGKEVHGSLYAERPEIREALQTQLPILHKSLQEQNIRLDKLDILDYSSQFTQNNHSQNTGEEANRPGKMSDYSTNHGGSLKNSGRFGKTDQTKTIRNFGYNTLELIA